jgi:hypothetical protein
MKRWMIVLALIALAACDRSYRGMETKSYQLARLSSDEAISLLTPYIGEGGYLSGKNGIITVREKPERLKAVEDLLKRFDGGGEAQDVVMTLQVIEADGFTERDTRIADIESTLRETFKYTGYRLLGETQVRAREDSPFSQAVENMQIRGRVLRMAGNRVPIEIQLKTEKAELGSTVTAEMGKPVVLGQSVGSGAIILVIRPSLAGT